MGLMFDPDLNETSRIAAGLVDIPVGQEQVKLSVHEGEEIYMILDGEGTFILDDREIPVTRHTAVYVRPGTKHRAINTGDTPLLLYWVNCPSVFREMEGGYRALVKDWKQVR